MVGIVGLSETTDGYVGFTPGAKALKSASSTVWEYWVRWCMQLLCNSIEWIPKSSFDRVACHCWRKETFSTSIAELIVQGVTEWASKAFALQLFDSMLGLRKLLHMATWVFILVLKLSNSTPSTVWEHSTGKGSGSVEHQIVSGFRWPTPWPSM